MRRGRILNIRLSSKEEQSDSSEELETGSEGKQGTESDPEVSSVSNWEAGEGRSGVTVLAWGWSADWIQAGSRADGGGLGVSRQTEQGDTRDLHTVTLVTEAFWVPWRPRPGLTTAVSVDQGNEFVNGFVLVWELFEYTHPHTTLCIRGDSRDPALGSYFISLLARVTQLNVLEVCVFQMNELSV